MDVTSSLANVHIAPLIKSAYAPSPSATLRHGGQAEPIDCPPVLNLSIHGRRRSPSPEKAQMKNCAESLSLQPASSSVCFSSPGSQGSSGYSDASFNAELSHQSVSTTQIHSKTKLPRPFKAYPKDPLTISFGMVTAETILGQDSSSDAYNEFRRRMMEQVQAQHQGTNKNMRRNAQKNATTNEDPTYWEKRRKNNEAAKRSRDARRAKEDEIAIRCAFLEQENLRLRYENATLRGEIERLRSMF